MSVLRQFKENAALTIKLRLAIQEIIKKEKIEASEEEIEAEIKTLSEERKEDIKTLKENEYVKEYCEDLIKTRKAKQIVIESVKFIKE